MNESRMQELERGLNNQAQKVLDVVPIEEPWEAKKIQLELARLNKHTERRVIDGCLVHLISMSLVKEPKPGHFQRVASKPKVEAASPIKVVPALQPPRAVAPSPVAPEPLDEFGACAVALRQLSIDASKLADRIEAAALAAEDRVQVHLADSTKLRQLQALLKP